MSDRDTTDLDEAVLNYRKDPSDENRDKLDAAGTVYVKEAARRMAEELMLEEG